MHISPASIANIHEKGLDFLVNGATLHKEKMKKAFRLM
jgi:hypothetical protein